jgi:hypothetical protein
LTPINPLNRDYLRAALWVRTADSTLLHFVDQRGSLHSKSSRRAISTPNYPIAGFERVENLISFHLFKNGHGHVEYFVSTKRLEFRNWGS